MANKEPASLDFFAHLANIEVKRLMRRCFTVNLRAIQASTRITPITLPNMGNKVKTSRGSLQSLRPFFWGSTPPRFGDSDTRNTGVAGIALTLNSLSLLRRSLEEAMSALPNRLYLARISCPFWHRAAHLLGGLERPPYPSIWIYIVYRNACTFLLYKKEQNSHVYWAGGAQGVSACMANTIIP